MDKIKALEKEIQKLRELAFKDELTHLFNRRGFKETSSKFLKEVQASKRFKDKRKSVIVDNFSLIVFDIDNFKKVNDLYGHDAGDEAIKKLGEIILERVRSIDVVSRWGGEEFVVGLVGANEHDAFVVADDIREKLEGTKIIWQKKKFHFTISGGVAGLNGKDLDGLFSSADKALYKAKNTGKNKIVKFSELKNV